MIPSYRDNLNRLPVWLYNAGVRDVVVAPGSRNAPLIATLERFKKLRLHSVRDERSAAFIALGFCLEGRPAAVCCTSGTALLNFYPAVCEAYYQRLPLIAISADRPPELIDQWDGQTIRQPDVFAAHIRAMVQWPDQLHSPYAAEDIDRVMHDALNKALGAEPGPVHINIPLRDPIYQGLDSTAPYPFIPWPGIQNELNSQIPEAWQTDLGKILVLCGQHWPDEALHASLSSMGDKFPVLCDISSNMLSAGSVANWENLFSFGMPGDVLQADTLITCGTAMLNKQLKQWLRAHPPKRHWHLQTGGWTGDPFQSNPQTVFGNPADLLDALYQQQPANFSYLKAWQVESNHAHLAFRERKGRVLRESPFSEWEALDFAFTYLPDSAAVHFGNSMAVRYGGWMMPSDFPGKTFSNRGTSGIDGCVSTALGYAVTHPEIPCFLFVGDISFFYDSNAFWNTLRPDNLKIVLLNNGGGNIFPIIDGPRQLPECEHYLETRHQRNADLICRDLGIYHTLIGNLESLERAWPEFLLAEGPRVLELLFAPETAPRIFSQLKG